jgi:hypothetical protein
MLNHVQQSSTQGSPSIVILGAREWKMELLAIWQRGFALSEMGVEGAGGGGYRREGVLGGGGGGGVCDGPVDTGHQKPKGEGGWCCRRWCAAKGKWAVLVRMEAGTHAGGTGEWWGQ